MPIIVAIRVPAWVPVIGRPPVFIKPKKPVINVAEQQRGGEDRQHVEILVGALLRLQIGFLAEQPQLAVDGDCMSLSIAPNCCAHFSTGGANDGGRSLTLSSRLNTARMPESRRWNWTTRRRMPTSWRWSKRSL